MMFPNSKFTLYLEQRQRDVCIKKLQPFSENKSSIEVTDHLRIRISMAISPLVYKTEAFVTRKLVSSGGVMVCKHD